MSISVCFIAMHFAGSLEDTLYMLPNCAPENTGNMTCYVESLSAYSTPVAVCFDKVTDEQIYFGPAYKELKA